MLLRWQNVIFQLCPSAPPSLKVVFLVEELGKVTQGIYPFILTINLSNSTVLSIHLPLMSIIHLVVVPNRHMLNLTHSLHQLYLTMCRTQEEITVYFYTY